MNLSQDWSRNADKVPSAQTRSLSILASALGENSYKLRWHLKENQRAVEYSEAKLSPIQIRLLERFTREEG